MNYEPLIYTSFGAMIGFIGNYIMETHKRKYELKKSLYFEVLDHVVKARKMNQDLLSDGMQVPKWMDKLDKEPFKSWFLNYELLHFKLDIIGEEKIIKLFESICDHPFMENVDDYIILYDDLKEIMGKELNKSWWEIWK